MIPAMEAFAGRFGKKGLTAIEEGFDPRTSVRQFWRLLKDLRKGEAKDAFVSLRNGIKPEKMGVLKRMRETLSYAWHRLRTRVKRAFGNEIKGNTKAVMENLPVTITTQQRAMMERFVPKLEKNVALGKLVKKSTPQGSTYIDNATGATFELRHAAGGKITGFHRSTGQREVIHDFETGKRQVLKNVAAAT